jgi:hypothetical protein
MSDLMLDVDQASELKAAFRRGDWTNSEIKRASEGNFLAQVRKVLLGQAEIVDIKKVVEEVKEKIKKTLTPFITITTGAKTVQQLITDIESMPVQPRPEVTVYAKSMAANEACTISKAMERSAERHSSLVCYGPHTWLDRRSEREVCRTLLRWAVVVVRLLGRARRSVAPRLSHRLSSSQSHSELCRLATLLGTLILIYSVLLSRTSVRDFSYLKIIAIHINSKMC